MKNQLKKFLLANWDGRAPFLLALSGGADSRLLFELLVELKEDISFTFSVAHVDHRWRSSSEHEASLLSLQARELSIPFHLKVLDPKNLKGNLESACREARLGFFKSLCDEFGYQAVMLAHHADDQSETVVKRIFEGASLVHLHGLQPVTEYKGLTLWRPLLAYPKKAILAELQRRSTPYFEDETNYDPQFLRARMRTRLLPHLNSEFGKDISSALLHIGAESFELKKYLDQKIAKYLDKIDEGPFGVVLKLKGDIPEASLEVRHLVQNFSVNTGLSLSREALYTASTLLTEGAANKCISAIGGQLYIDRYSLFVLKKDFPSGGEAVELMPGHLQWGDWDVYVDEYLELNRNDVTSLSSWCDVWQGEFDVALPSSLKPYTLCLPPLSAQYNTISSIRKWWNNAKTPSFLRPLVPVIMHDGQIVHEFLTGRRSLRCENNYLRLKFKFRK